ncbi:MAG: tyrosine-type recombinase/integrase [Nannocystaceae bacterium]
MLDGPLGRNERHRTRNRALSVVMRRSGLRVSEALGLRMDDLRPGNGRVWVRRGKGGKPRLAGMGPESFEAWRPWLELRGELGLDPGGPLLYAFNGNARGCGRSWGFRSGCAPTRCGIRTRTSCSARAMRPNLIQLQLGHARLDSTDMFLRKIGPNEAVAVVSRRGWEVAP